MRSESGRKYIVVVGSLLSGLGKGIVTSSIGKLLQSRGLKVTPIKFDGYLNVDCGTMNPYRHGEVYVLEDGTECDMDFGTYERFLGIDLNSSNSLTGGKIFRLVIDKERKGGYLGYDVQFVPHLTNEIKKWIREVGETAGADVVLVEVGGTVGDLENGYFLEAMRQLSREEQVLFIQLTYVPTIEALGEQKTKPTQHANKLLASMGILPEVVICREVQPLSAEARKKIALFCNVAPEEVIDDVDIESIYELPILFQKQGLPEMIAKKIDAKAKDQDLKEWSALVEKVKKPGKMATIAITGKYTALRDAYVSIKEALVHAGAHLDAGVKIKWVETTEIEDGKVKPGDALKDVDGILVPGGFGERGAEGKIACIKHARENKIPFLGLCFGLQLAVVEWARNEAGLKDANSTEIDEKTKYPVIDLLPEQKRIIEKGATMRLGAYPCKLKKGTKAHAAYGKDLVSERHRHRYEVNPDYVAALEKSGLVVSGVHPEKEIVEVVEWPDGWGVATQAHPEFKSRFEKPAPLFTAFLREVLKKEKKKA